MATPVGPQPLDDYINWKIGSGVNPNAETEARAAFRALSDYLLGINAPPMNRRASIFLYHDLDSLVAEFESTTGRDKSWLGPNLPAGKSWMIDSKDFIALNTSAERYQEISPGERKSSLAAGIFKVYRRALTGIWERDPRSAVSREGPTWLREGDAEYFAFQAVEPPGSQGCYTVRGHSGAPPLDKLETSDGFHSQGYGRSRQVAFSASELLAEMAGPRSIPAYYSSLSTGISWQEAFKSAFDMTVGEFYEQFERHGDAGLTKEGCPSFTTPVAIPGAPEYVKWVIGDDVSDEDRRNSLEAVRAMHDYLVSLGGPLLEDDARFYLLYDLDELAAALSWETSWSVAHARDYARGGVAMAGEGYAFFDISRKTPTSPRDNKMKITAHEFYHIWQHGLSGLKHSSSHYEVPEGGPRWLTEGAAEFSAYRAMSDIGVLSYDGERGGLVLRGQRADKPLSELGTVASRTPGVGYYPYFLLAGELLASYAGEKALIHYYTLTQPGITWQEAFEAAFGMTVWDFYELFEEHRAAGFPEVEIPISVDE